jgi:orotate phosphoribosyltransferase
MDQLLIDAPAATLLSLKTDKLRSPLLDLFCRGAYQEGDLCSVQPAQHLLHQRQAGDAAPPGGTDGRPPPARPRTASTVAVAGLTLGADPWLRR